MDESPRPASQPPVAWAPPPPPRTDGGFSFSDFLGFRYLITPGFITVIYVVGAVLITLSALVAVATPAGAGPGGAVVGAIIVLIIGNLWWRIILEFVMVLFRINDSLASIDRRGRGM